MSAPSIPLLARAASYGARSALIVGDERYSYQELLQRSATAAARLLGDRQDLQGARVAFLTPADLTYAVTKWAIWRAGAIAVPLCTQHPPPELRHVIRDSGASVVIAHPTLAQRLHDVCAELAIPLQLTDTLMRNSDGEPARSLSPALPHVEPERGALILYTSGTTGKPKGVVTTHATLAAQLTAVTTAWEYSPSDHNLLVLPLHHLHGILNVLWGTLWAGGVCEMHTQFSADTVFQRITSVDGPTIFMAVPTIYAKLISTYDAADDERKTQIRAGCQRLRLMVSGSAALPIPTLEKFRAISGHTLLERYGMTEIGMALGNPLHGERRPGHVGQPFPDVEVRVVDEHDQPLAEGEVGQLQVRGPNVFQSYWNRPQDTTAAFTADHFFRTGDVGVCEQGSYRILGRASVDILKTGGYKVSALDIEACLRTHPAIADCAVVGVPDPEWGQRVAACVMLHADCALTLEELRMFGKQHLAAYKVPSLLLNVENLPRNAMGKVQKKAVAALFTPAD